MKRILSVAEAVLAPGVFTSILAIFTAMVGFYVTSVVEELRSGHTAIYSFERDRKTQTILFHLENISRAKRIEEANILIRCKDQRMRCFKPIAEADGSTVSQYARPEVTPPNFGMPLNEGNSTSDTINVCLGAIAGSRSSLRFKLHDSMQTELIALYNPWSKRCGAESPEATNILLLRPWDLHAIAAKHYFSAIGVALIVFLVALSATAAFRVRDALRRNREGLE